MKLQPFSKFSEELISFIYKVFSLGHYVCINDMVVKIYNDGTRENDKP